MALVSSSTNSGTPSALTRICSSKLSGERFAPGELGHDRACSASRESFERFSATTWPCPDHRDWNSGRWVSTTRSGMFRTRSTMRSSSSRLVGIGPVRILEQHHRGLPARHRLDHVDQRADRFFLLPLRGHGQWPVALLARDGEHRGDEADVLERAPVLSHHQPFELVELGGCRFVAVELERPFEAVDGRVEGAIDMVRRALQAQRALDLVLQALAQRIQDARLADARLSREQHHLAFAFLRESPALGEKSDLLLAPHQGRQPRVGSGLEAAGRGADPDDAPGAGRLGDAFQEHADPGRRTRSCLRRAGACDR